MQAQFTYNSLAMKLPILGATGLTGHQLVQQALDAGHSVAALARDPRKVTEPIADKAKADAMIEASPLEWTIVRPVRLTNGPRTGKYRVVERRELTERKWIQKIAVIA
jgi:uncharacterized protein YbjT (DUF2867 family)